MWNNKTVAVIFPTLGDSKNIREVIQDFDSTGYVDEIVVVDNDRVKRPTDEIKKSRARLVNESQRGYGAAVRAGIRATQADLLIISDPDGSFSGRDIVKFLSYSDDFEMVFGSRTHIPLIQKKNGMGFWRRIADVLLGKIVSLLFIAPPLTDVGCSYRLTSRKAWQKISKEARSDSDLFIAEWLVLSARNKVKFIQIPVNYQSKAGREGIWRVLTVFLCILIARFRGSQDKPLKELNPRYS